MSETPLVNVVIDGTPLAVPQGEMIIESARRIGIEIPHFCYHPRLSKEAGANCRMCLVEVSMPRRNPDGTSALAKMPKPQTSCSLPASEGMVIETESPAIVEARRGILEFLLINHPLDCPICDRGGECPLQNNTLHYGPPTTRHSEDKRHANKAHPLSSHVVLDRERCIHCARCTRFAADISGDAQLGFLKRGADMRIASFAETEFTSLFSGNVIELCPVGALLSRDYRFRGRPWDLATQKSLCTECSNGCNIKLDHREGRLVRVNARINDAVNEEWTCDRGKFGMDYISTSERLRRPLIRREGRFVEAAWDEALALTASKLRDAGERAAFLGGDRSSNEDLYVIRRLFREVLLSSNLDHRYGPAFPGAADLVRLLGHSGCGTAIADLEMMGSILVFGSDLAVEQPMLYLRVRKGWLQRGATVVEVQPSSMEQKGHANRLAPIAASSVYYGPGESEAAAWSLLDVYISEHPEAAQALPEATRATLRERAWPKESSDRLRSVAAALQKGPQAIIVGLDVRSSSEVMSTLEALTALATLCGAPGSVSMPCDQVNAQGAVNLGILPDAMLHGNDAMKAGMDAGGILAGLIDGQVRAVWVGGCDYVSRFHDPAYASRCLEASPFTAVTALTLNDTARMADVVLPITSVAERDGTYTNVEGRVQRFRQAFQGTGDVRDEWQVAAAIAARLGAPMRYAGWQDVLYDIAANVPGYSRCRPELLGDQGVRVDLSSMRDPDAQGPSAEDDAHVMNGTNAQ